MMQVESSSCPQYVPPANLVLHVDANRDGNIDDAPSDGAAWSSGMAGSGAVILCNNNRSDGRARPQDNGLEDPAVPGGIDNTDAVINTAADETDLAQFEIRKDNAAAAFSPGCRGRLSVAGNLRRRLRVFSSATAANAREIIGPATSSFYEFDATGAFPMTLAMEALSYPEHGFDGNICLTLETLSGAGTVLNSSRANIRVAPWIAFNNCDQVTRVLVARNQADPVREAFLVGLRAAMAGVTLTEVDSGPYNHDRWFRDVMKVGHATLPSVANNAPRCVAMRTANDRYRSHRPLRLDLYAWDAAGPQLGYVSPVPHPFTNGGTFDSFGNMDCSPPVTVNGRFYPFGRIVHGYGGRANQFDYRIQDFLDAQEMQHPFTVYTGWLDVGHVDEIFTFCPWPGCAKGFKLLMASPHAALVVVDQAHATGGAGGFFATPRQNRAAWNNCRHDYPVLTVEEVFQVNSFFHLQQEATNKMKDVRAEMKRELGLEEDDIIDLPVLFTDARAGFISYMPNVVNMLVLTTANGTHLCIPKPHGPALNGNCIFETAVRQTFADRGWLDQNAIHFVDDFYSYHTKAGEIHCGTNELRSRAGARWWEV